MSGGAGDDSIDAGDGNDTVYGGDGADSVEAGAGDDVIHGDGAAETPAVTSIDLNNYDATDSGFGIVARRIENGEHGEWSADHITEGYGGIGVDGDYGGIPVQLGHDPVSGLSEELAVTFEVPVDSAEVEVLRLFSGEGSGGEQGHWAVFSGDQLVGEGDFQAPSGHETTVTIDTEAPFDRIVFSATPYGDGPNGSNDSSDYIIRKIDATHVAAGDDLLYGGAGDDTLDGGAGADVLDGGTEDDVLSGGAGADAIAGGTGDDTFAGTAAELDGDSLTDYEDGETISITDAVLGEDNVTISSANGVTTIALDTDGDGQADSTLEVDGEYAYLTVEPDGQGGTNLSVSATPTDLTLMGTPQEDTLVGGDGNDTISALESADLVSGGAGDDSIDAGDGNDTVYGGDGADSVEAGAGDDSLEGGAGEDTLEGGSGADTLEGGADADVLDGGTEDDVLSGGAGADVVAGGTGDDTFAGTAAELDGDSLTDYEDGETISITDAVLGEDNVTISSSTV